MYESIIKCAVSKKKNLGEGGGFCKSFLRQKTCVGDGGELERARWMTCKTVRSCCEKRMETKLCKSR